jgi:hypothetical protein
MEKLPRPRRPMKLILSLNIQRRSRKEGVATSTPSYLENWTRTVTARTRKWKTTEKNMERKNTQII